MKILGSFIAYAGVVAVLASAIIFPPMITGAAWAQEVSASAGPLDPTGAATIVSWLCSNQQTVIYVLGILIAHSGFSVLSATLKKAGITSDSPIVKIIRMLAIDVKPPAESITAQADAIKAQELAK